MRVAIGSFRFLVAVIAIAGVLLQVLKSSTPLRPFVTFTIQSNLLVAACFAVAAWRTFRDRPSVAPLLKGAVTVYILITALVYKFILAGKPNDFPPPPQAPVYEVQANYDSSQALRSDEWPVNPQRKPYSLPSKLLHIVVPIMAVADWLLFDARRRYRWRYAVIWIAYPVVYLIFVLSRGVLFPGTKYPYPFLDVARIGYHGVASNGAIYGLAFVLLGLAIVAIDRTLPGKDATVTE
ncbi:MAG: Pr6Pr family membrane protein [Candidatus Hydrogenedentes bacterium]|nr:Pr6Pr family membrane protein [Candidatus Hydrogenedentota bacterium]